MSGVKLPFETEAIRIHYEIDYNDLEKIQNGSGETLLHIAAKYGDLEVIKHLIEAGSNVDAQDNLGKTPIVLSLENRTVGFLKVVKMLYSANASIHVIDKFGRIAAQLVFDDINGIDNDKSSISFGALCAYEVNDVYNCVYKLFLNMIYKENMNNSEETAETLIKLHCPIWKAVLLQNTNVVEHMIVRGCPVNSYHPCEKFTALRKAVQLMDLEMFNVLIKYGADVDFADCIGLLPIAYYGIEIPGSIQHPEIIKILLSKTVHLEDLNQYNVSVQFRRAFECGNKEVIQMLLEHHKDILNISDVEGLTPLHYLSRNYHPDVTEALQGQEIDVNVKDVAGRTPLFTAAEYRYSHINTFKFLLKNGANVNVLANRGFDEVPLVFAFCQNYGMTRESYFEILDLFLEYDLDIQFVGSEQTTVFDVIRSDSFYIAEPLLANLAMLDVLKKPIDECIRYKIDSNVIFKKCYDTCIAELTEMKNYIVNKNLTFYLILVNRMSEEQVLKSCRYSPNAHSTFKELKNKVLPSNHYYSTIQNRISSIISQLELSLEAASIVCKLLKFSNDPNHLVVIEIISYLNIQDLKALIYVGI